MVLLTIYRGNKNNFIHVISLDTCKNLIGIVLLSSY
jgi:hypothetical protein